MSLSLLLQGLRVYFFLPLYYSFSFSLPPSLPPSLPSSLSLLLLFSLPPVSLFPSPFPSLFCFLFLQLPLGEDMGQIVRTDTGAHTQEDSDADELAQGLRMIENSQQVSTAY